MEKKKDDDEEYDWIYEAHIQRRTLYANAILVETDDTKRIEELLDRIPAMAKSKKSEERWYVLDAWEGLSEITKNKKDQSVRLPIEGLDVQSYGVSQILPEVSKILYEGNVVLVITNIFKSDPKLDAAIRGWATSDVLRDSNSTIMVFADDRSMFPSEVWSHMKIIKPPKSTWNERCDMIQHHDSTLTPEIMLTEDQVSDAVRLTSGMNLDQLEASLIESVITTGRISLDILAKVKTEILASNPVVEIIQQPKFGFEAVGGYNTLKERIMDSIVLPMKNPEISDRFDIQPPRGILLFGAPGVGKTLLVKSMAKELNMSILRILPENIKGKYVGESEKSLRKVFDIADAMSPVIVLIDEFDRLGKRDAGPQTSSNVDKELFSMLLEKLGDENRQWFFAAATNLIEAIDPAMRRTGRIDSVVPVPYPDEEARAEIIKIHTTIKRKLPIESGIDFKKIAKKTYMWSGSDIEQLAVRTAQFVMKEAIKNDDKKRIITMEDFEKILDTFNIDIEDNKKVQRKIESQALKYTNDKRLKDVFEHAETTHPKGKINLVREMLDEEKIKNKKVI